MIVARDEREDTDLRSTLTWLDSTEDVSASREAAEELGIDTSGRLSERPLFLSVTETIGMNSGHTDVSLWFVLSLSRDEPVSFDRREFRAMRWWSADELNSADTAHFDPALDRFLRKLTTADA